IENSHLFILLFLRLHERNLLRSTGCGNCSSNCSSNIGIHTIHIHKTKNQGSTISIASSYINVVKQHGIESCSTVSLNSCGLKIHQINLDRSTCFCDCLGAYSNTKSLGHDTT